MIRHALAGMVLCVGAAGLGALLFDGSAGCGGCPPACHGTILSTRIDPPLPCVEVEPGEIDGGCGCHAQMWLHNGCDTEFLVATGDAPGPRCPDDPTQARCDLVAPGETTDIRQEGDARLSFPLWKDDVLYEIVAEVQLEFD